MQREVCTSRVSKIGLMFLATFKNKSRSVVSKRDLESAFGTCKAQTQPLGRAAILLYLPFFFLIIITQWWRQEFSDGGLTLPTRGAKIWFSGY